MVLGSLQQETRLVIIGAGPGGYVAAIRAADLGIEVLLIDERDQPGGTCLQDGCIPSKSLVNAVELVQSARHARTMGISFEALNINPDELRRFTKRVTKKLTGGITSLLRKRGVDVLKGRARFTGPNTLAIEGAPVSEVRFEQCIIATGSRTASLDLAAGLPVWTPAEALRIPNVPERLVVIGSGYVALELSLIFAGLSSWVTLVGFHPRLLPGADSDLVDVMMRGCRDRFDRILSGSRVTAMEHSTEGFVVEVEQAGETRRLEADEVLVALERIPNTDDLGLEHAGLPTDDAGFITVDHQCRTPAPHIFAIGDITPGPMLAHKASREAKVAAEAVAGHRTSFQNSAIPAVVFTDPEIASVGRTEEGLREEGTPYKVGRFPFMANGRSKALGYKDGFVKILAHEQTDRILGAHVLGPRAGDLIAELGLAVMLQASAEDVALTVHSHPTLAEAIREAALDVAGEAIHL